MTPTGEQLYNSPEFWQSRLQIQLRYRLLLTHRLMCEDISEERYEELKKSCYDVLEIIQSRIEEIKNAGAKR